MTDQGLTITMSEWERRGPDNDSRLQGRELESSVSRTLAEGLRKSALLKVTELKSGLEVRSFSHVGRIRLGAIEVRIVPKVGQPTLLNLLRYAFGFRQLRLFDDVSQSLEAAGFEDLLVYQLNAESAELIARGLHRNYQPQHADLSSPRGRIDMPRLVRQGGVITAQLPCRFFPRIEDCGVNRVLLAGLQLASIIACDPQLRRQSQRLAKTLDGQVSGMRLDAIALARVRRGMNRLTTAYEPAVSLIELLVTSHGLSLRDAPSALPLPGFLFDMNRFFQALMSRFLHDHLSGYTVRDEAQLRGMIRYVPGFNPRGWRAPILRPDIVVMEGPNPVAVLDAKYRDLWDKRLPRDMLYQVAIYAAVHPERTATILYPTTADEARSKDTRIEVRDPWRGARVAQVILRPVVLPDLEGLLTARSTAANERQRRAFARQLAFGR